MAEQDVIRALVPRTDVGRVRETLQTELGLDESMFDIQDADPGVYRDKKPELELRRLVRAGRVRMAVGALAGGLIGVVIALVIPFLRDLAPMSVALFALGGVVAGGVVFAARSVQVRRDSRPSPEELHVVDESGASDQVIVSIRGVSNPTAVVDHLDDQGINLLDSGRPRVQRHEGARSHERDL